MSSLLTGIELKKYDLSTIHLSSLNDKTILVKKWVWDYDKAHLFQQACVAWVDQNPSYRILICCSHPRVLTNGRGLQKARKGETLELQDFNPDDHATLPFPLHQTRRGGGLTFHHPGQFVFYPIVKLNPSRLSLSALIDDVFNFSIEILESWGAQGLTQESKYLGIWHGTRKIASLGIAIEKLTTFHGMALNIFKDQVMLEALAKLNPCGLTSNVYSSAEEISTLPENAIEEFCQKFLEKVKANWC